MPTFTFTSPQGKTYDVNGPEGSTKEEAYGILQQRLGGEATTPTAEPDSMVDRIPGKEEGWKHVSPNGVGAPKINPMENPAAALRQEGSDRFKPVTEAVNKYLFQPMTALGPAGVIGEIPQALSQVPKVIPAIKAAGSAVKSAAGDLFGSKLGAATKEATAGAREAVQSGINTGIRQGESFSQTAGKEDLRVKAMGDVRDQLAKRLDSYKTTPPDLNAQGMDIHNVYNSAIDSAKGIRQAQAGPLYEEAAADGLARFAKGERVDTSGATAAIDKTIDLLDGIPDAQGKLKTMRSAITGPPPKQPESLIILPDNVPRPPPVEGGKTVEQLVAAKQYLYDIANSGEMQGYDAIVRRSANQAAKAVDLALEKFSPKYAEANRVYRELSQPIESLNTRLGKALTATEGGLKGEAYASVPKQKLPDRIFSSREGIEILTDALAGGKSATGEARVAAQQQVDQMVENWLMEKNAGKSGTAAADAIKAPQVRATLSGAPAVESKLSKLYGERAGIEQTIPKVEKAAGEAESRSAGMTKMAGDTRAQVAKIKSDLEAADTLAGNMDKRSQSEALAAYKAALKRGREAGLIPAEKYDAAVGLVGRANSLEETRALAGKVMKWLGLGVAAGVAPEVVSRLPARAEGGPVVPGQPYVVGERGPEVIVPQAPGTVIPTNALQRATGVTGDPVTGFRGAGLNPDGSYGPQAPAAPATPPAAPGGQDNQMIQAWRQAQAQRQFDQGVALLMQRGIPRDQAIRMIMSKQQPVQAPQAVGPMR